MIRPLLAAALTALAGPALALSCMPHDLARTYAEAAQSEHSYVVVHGRLSFDETRLPKVNFEQQHKTPPNTLIPARLNGKSLGPEGFAQNFDKKITLNVQCLGPWCAGGKSDVPYLAFLQKRADGYLLALSPCGGFGFPNPAPALLEKATRCFRGDPCQPEPMP